MTSMTLTGCGTVSSWSPRSISGIAAWWDPSDLSTMFQDTAGTTPVTADGQSVARIDDKSGNSLNLLQGTAANQPLYKTSGGLHWLEFDGSTDIMALASTSALNLGTTNLAIAIAFRQFANGGNYKTVFAKTNNATGNNYRAFIDDAYGLRLFYGTDSQASSNSGLTATQGQDWVGIWGRDAANDRYELNGTSATQAWAAAGTGSTTYAASIFGDGSATYAMGGRFYGGIIVDAYPGSTDMALLKTVLGSKAGLSL